MAQAITSEESQIVKRGITITIITITESNVQAYEEAGTLPS